MIATINKNVIVLWFFFSAFSIIRVNCCYAKVRAGDSYGGGTVFCVSPKPVNELEDISQCMTEGSGDYGLIVSIEDQINFNSNPEHGVTWDEVALFFDNYKHDEYGHDDWYLPSIEELTLMYDYAKANNLIGKGCSGKKSDGVQCFVGGSDNIYWSSSISPLLSDLIIYKNFGSGRKGISSKSFYYGVRLIRSFKKEINDKLYKTQ